MAQQPEPITAFRNEYSFLSNFYRQPFVWMGRAWPTAEHAYQWAKCLDRFGNIVHVELAAKIAAAPTPGKAKRLGQAPELNTPEWRGRRVLVMESVVKAKFTLVLMRDMLDATWPRELIEGNQHGDRFWGTVDGVGSNHLGKILMKCRKENRLGTIFDKV